MNINKKTYNKDFLKQFILAAVRVIERDKFHIEQPKLIVDADLIPELSQELVREYTLNEELKQLEEMDFLEHESVQQNQTLTPIKRKAVQALGVKPANLPPAKRMQQQPYTPPANITEGNGYQKILPLLMESTVSRIQCIAPNKPLSVIRQGQKHTSKISLTPEQIHDVFQEVAEQAHIPLIEGPFKVALNEFTMEGINARITDSKFIIQKNTAYSMLEGQQMQGPSGHMPQRRLPQRRMPSRR